MRALKKARKLIESQPTHPSSTVLSTLVVALESDAAFQLSDLYKLDYDDFRLALDLLGEWRLDRYYASKARLLDLSVQVDQMRSDTAAA